MTICLAITAKSLIYISVVYVRFLRALPTEDGSEIRRAISSDGECLLVKGNSVLRTPVTVGSELLASQPSQPGLLRRRHRVSLCRLRLSGIGQCSTVYVVETELQA